MQLTAKMAGYRGSTLASLEKCSNLKRTHNFLLQVWEAMYITMIKAFINTHDKQALLEHISQVILINLENNLSPIELINKVHEIVIETNVNNQFVDFIKLQGGTDKTWKFWTDFVFKHCYAYITLFLSIRGELT
jgi:hypothetical protein